MNYIPQRDADARDWYNNFNVVVAANLAALGLVAGDASPINAAAGTYSTAYTVAVNPSTRNASTVAAKDAAKANASFVIRPFAQRIQANPNVTNLLRVQLGLTIRDRAPTRNPAPVTQPLLNVVNATPGVHLVRFADSASPAARRKPPLVTSMQLFEAVTDGDPAPDPSVAVFVGNFGRNPIRTDQDPLNVGKTATYFARWMNRRGEVGPWSAGASLTIAF